MGRYQPEPTAEAAATPQDFVSLPHAGTGMPDNRPQTRSDTAPEKARHAVRTLPPVPTAQHKIRTAPRGQDKRNLDGPAGAPAPTSAAGDWTHEAEPPPRQPRNGYQPELLPRRPASGAHG